VSEPAAYRDAVLTAACSDRSRCSTSNGLVM
jgi:hypothetical protein